MSRTLIRGLLVGILAVALGPQPARLAGQAAPDTVYSGCGGGKTGGGSGLVVASSGSIARWRRSRAGQPRTIVATWVDTAGAARVLRAVHAARFRSISPGKPSNWTCFFRLVDPAGTHEVPYQWPNVPAALRELDSLFQVLARHGQER